ncbi:MULTISPECIES: NAD-dependent epimerase/dehydratase family protein [unclassified Nocardioides]|uniref:NAD-dependent epimerase/dehydratase family protein n=1 Tax=unclassified Nocardioides TaxID=2615069 RepID=UPI0009EF9FB0|nr:MULTISPECIES: NAD(P)-dependent oxidoreductase [unclassified Nocardioides]GAW49170.1 NAD-dependent epimerase/dehydratase [Nocardioides sp. PD653-B2]GAW55658.1 NAD-dependent epimerase/dehydratase [Nocardioides sp. PD653]
MPAKILLTGAAGLVGRAVARQLRRDGLDYVAIDQTAAVIDGHDVIECDVRDVHRLHDLAVRHRFDAIAHCAGYSGPMLGQSNPAAVIAVNVGGTANLLEVARVHSIERFVFCSSVSAVGPTSAAITEEVVLCPTTVYGATKAACEQLIAAYQQTSGITAVSLRLAAVWGPERTTVCALGATIKDAVEGRETVFESGGGFPTQYLHVEDAAQAVLLALKVADPRQGVYNVNGGEYLTFAAVADEVRSVLPQARVTVGPGGDPLYEWQEQFDISAARRDLGFEPQISLREGIEAFADAVARGGDPDVASLGRPS